MRPAVVHVEAHRKGAEDLPHAADVISVGMGCDHQIQRIDPEATQSGDDLHSGTRVDERRPPLGGLDQHGIALAHVQEGDAHGIVLGVERGRIVLGVERGRDGRDQESRGQPRPE